MTLEPKSKQEIWQKHIDGWRQSQLTQKGYCKSNDLSFANFSYWRTRINQLVKSDKKFIPVAVGQSHPIIRVFLPGGLPSP